MTPFLSRKIALFLSFVLGAGILLFFLVSGIDRAIDPASLLPHDTAVLVDLRKPVANINKFRRSKFGTRISSMEWQDILQEVGFPETKVRDFLDMVNQLEMIVRSPFFSELFGRRIMLGLVPADTSLSMVGGQAGIEKMMVLLARPRHKASLVDFFSGFFLDELEYTAEPYKGRVVKTYDYEGRFAFFTAVTDGLVVVSFSKDLVKRCIDNAINNMTTDCASMQGNEEYRRLKRRARGRDDQFFYIDVVKLRDMVEESLYSGGYPPHSGYYDGFLSVKADFVQRIAVFRQPANRIVNYSTIVQYNPDAGPLIRHLPSQDPIIAMLPDNNVIHLWMNFFNIRWFWNFLRSERNMYVDAFVQGIEDLIADRAGLEIEEFFSFFGSQISLNVAEMKSSGIFSMPRVSIYFEVRDRDKVHDIVKKLCAGLELREFILAGKKVYSIVLAGGLMQPSFMFHDNFFILADNRKQLELLYTPHQKFLLKHPLFKKTDVGLTETNNFVLYYRNAELIDGLKELVRWYGSLLQLFDGESQVKNRLILEKIVLPVLDGLKMYKIKTVRAFSLERELILKSSHFLEKEPRG